MINQDGTAYDGRRGPLVAAAVCAFITVLIVISCALG